MATHYAANFRNGRPDIGAVPVVTPLTGALDKLGKQVNAGQEAKPRPPTNSAANFQIAKEGWLKALAACPGLSGADYAVAIAISVHLNSKRFDAWPSLETLAEMTNRDQSTVWRSVRRLKRLTLLEVREGGGRNVSNRYRPLFGDLDPKTLRRGKKTSANSQRKHCELAERTSEEV